MTKNFTADRIRLGLAELFTGSTDPTAGVAAQIGTIYLRNTGSAGTAWQKLGAADTAWTQLQQSFNWFSVTNFGALGNGVADDRVAIAAAIAACIAAGGGVVYFPQGTYACSKDGANPYSFDLNAATNIQFLGSGLGSIIKQSGSAGTNPWSLFRIRGGSASIRFQNLTLDGSGLTNPSASPDSHLINAVGAVTTLQVFDCRLTGTVTGDGLHCVGTAGNLVSRVMVRSCDVLSCSQYGIHFGEGVQYGWIVNCYMKACQTEISCIASANVTQDSIEIIGNEIEHTSVAERRAIIVTGNATARCTKLVCAQNVVITGFSQFDNIQYATIVANIQTSGAYASATAVMALTGAVDCTITKNILDRAGASAGPCISLDASTVTPTDVAINDNACINEVKATADIVQYVSLANCTNVVCNFNRGRSTDVDASVAYGYEIKATSVNVDNIVFSGNRHTSAAGSLIAPMHYLVNGANIGVVTYTYCQFTECDYTLEYEDAGVGSFNGARYMVAGNNVTAAVGFILRTGGTAVIFDIGWNAGTFGPSLKTGSGTPEGAVSARIGSMFERDDGPPTVYYKETGNGTNTGWIGVGGGQLNFGIGDAGTAATALYLLPGFSTGAAGATEIQYVVTRPGTIRNLRVHITGAGTDNQTVTYTVRKNGVDTTIVATKANDTNGDTSDLTHSTTVVAGDLISIKVTKGGVVTAGQTNVLASLELA